MTAPARPVRYGLRIKVGVWSVVMFLAATMAMMAIAGLISDRWTERMGQALARELVLRYADRLNAYLAREILLVRMTVQTPSLLAWVADGDRDPELRSRALSQLDQMGQESESHQPIATMLIDGRYRRFSTLREEGVDTVVNLSDMPRNQNGEWFWQLKDTFKREPERQYVVTISAEMPRNAMKVWVNAPIRDNTDHEAIISTGASFSALDLKFTNGPPGHEVMLVDADGLLRLHKDPALIGRSAGELYGLETRTIKAMLAGQVDGGTAVSGTRGNSRWFLAAEGLGFSDLVLLIAIPDDGAARQETFLPLAAGLTGCVLALLLIIHFGVRRMVIDPLASMESAVRHFAQGHFGARVAETRTDELGGLASAFNGMAERLERYTHELEDIVHARTEEARTERDRADAAFARERDALRQYKQFAALISHEFRNPLAIIKGKSQLMELIAMQGAEPDPESLDAINRAVTRLQTLFDQWLAGETLTDGQFPFVVERIELCPFLDRILAIAPRSDRLTVALEPVSAGLSVDADPALLRAALLNLLDNAVKYSPDGGEVTLRALDMGGRVAIQVTDSGIGIAPEHQGRLFERHFRVHPEDGPHGLGLGLFMVREVARLHGGEVTVSSILGEGSVFTLLLPSAVTTG